jgi:hypothetical protein
MSSFQKVRQYCSEAVSMHTNQDKNTINIMLAGKPSRIKGQFLLKNYM